MHIDAERVLLRRLFRANDDDWPGVLRRVVHVGVRLPVRMLRISDGRHRHLLLAARVLLEHMRATVGRLHNERRLLPERDLRDHERRNLRGQLHDEC
jgi:hypothetical protein